MVLKSPISVPILLISIPSFVFKSPTEPLPDHPLYISLDQPNLSISTQDYRLLSQRFAEGLRKNGFQDGNRVLLASENRVHFSIVFMGTLMAGGVFVGVNKTNSSHDLVRNIRQADPHIVLLGSENMDRVSEVIDVDGGFKNHIFHFDDTITGEDTGIDIPHWSKILTHADTAKDFRWPVFTSREEADQTASLIYSSGTSGNLKAVELSHHQLVASIIQNGAYSRANISPKVMAAVRGKPGLAFVALSQVLGQTSVCISSAMARSPMLITAKRGFASIQNFIIQHELALVVIYPSFMTALMKDEALRKRVPKMKSLRVLMLTGGPISELMCTRFMNFWETFTGQQLTIRVAYGMTELAGGVNSAEIGASKRAPEVDLLANNEMKIMCFDGLREVDEGEQGEIYCRGPHVAKGYWQEPEHTKAVFLADGWVKTGDVGSIDSNGALIVHGRKKDYIHTANGDVAPLQIEEVLLLHPDIRDAVVCAISKSNGPVNRRIRAYITSRQDAELKEHTVVNFLKAQAPHLPDLDGGVSFVNSIPVVSNHKPEREVLMLHD